MPLFRVTSDPITSPALQAVRDVGPAPVRIAVEGESDVIVGGLEAMLQPYADRVVLVAGDALQDPPVDLLLLDLAERADRAGTHAARTGGLARFPRLVVYTWDVPAAIATADAAVVRLEVAGYVGKAVAAADLVDALERIHRRSPVVAHGSHVVVVPGVADDTADWLGRSAGLTEREGDVLLGISEGRTNQEVAERCYLSVNTVKTYVRSTYRKIGVDTRSQAVLWAIDHGARQISGRRAMADLQAVR